MNTTPKEDYKNYSSIEELLESYKGSEPEWISVGPTVGIDCWFFTAGVNNAYITVEDVAETTQKIIGIQGNAELRVSRFISIKCCLIGAADDIDVRDELELFDKAKDKGGFRELSCKDSFGYYASPNTIMSEAASNQGLYYLYDGDELVDKQYVMSVVGVGELDWLKKIGIPDIDLKMALMFQINTFEDEFKVAGGVKFTLANKPAFSAVVSVGFKQHELDSLAFAVKGEVSIGPVTITALGFGLSGMAGKEANTIAVEVGMAFGKKVALPSTIAKLLDTEEKMFLVEVVGNGEVATDFNNIFISVQGNILGFIEINGHYRYSNGYHHEVGLSVGTVKSSSFRFRVAGDVGWDKDSLSVKIALEGNYKTDFSVKAFGKTWEFAALDVGGGVTFDYNSKTTHESEYVARKDSSLCISLYGHANVKILFVKFGVQVSKNWFIKDAPDYVYSSPVRSVIPDDEEPEYIECSNIELQSLTREELSAMPGLPAQTRGDVSARYDETISTDEFPRELLEEFCLELDYDCEGKSLEVMVAAQYTLKDCYWEIVTNGAIYTSDDDLSDTPVSVTEINHSQYQLSVANPQAGPWIIDIYGSKDWNGAILMNAELGNPVETSLVLDEVSTEKKEIVIYDYDDEGNIKTDEAGNQIIDDSYVGNVTKVTFTYQARAEGTDSLVLLCMEEAGSQEHNGVVVTMLEATTGDDTKTVTIEIPYDIQGGQYAFYIKAMSSDWNGAAYSQYTDVVNVIPQTARLYAEGLAITGNVSDPNNLTAAFTLVNDGSENVTNAHVELIFECPENDSILILADDVVSLDAGASNDFSYNIDLPEGFDTAKGRLSLRLDAEDAIEEGIFDGAADTSQLISTARFLDSDETGTEDAVQIHWETVAGAVSYTLKYALNQDWANSISIEGLTGNTTRLQLAAGRYFYNISAIDEQGIEIADKDSGKFDVASRNELLFSQQDDIIRTDAFYLYNGLYRLENIYFGNYTGTIAVHQVYNEENDVIMTLQLEDGQMASLQPLVIGTGRYFLSTTPSSADFDTSDLSLTLIGDLIADNNSQRVPVCISDTLNDEGEYFETVSSSIGGNAPDDIWSYTLNQGGLLTLNVTTTEEMNSALIFKLYVKNDEENAEEDYSLVNTTTISDETDEIILNKYSILNNFYIEVCSEDGDQVLEHTDYTMSVFFDAFHADVIDDAVLDTDEDGSMTVSGWIGYADASDSFLLSIGENDGGLYSICLKGEQESAGLNVYSTSGELLASAVIAEDGTASIENMELYAGNYFIDIVSQDDGQGACNTDFILSVTPEKLFAYMDSVTSCCIIDAEDKFLMGLHIEEDGQYDISQLEIAHNAKIYNTLNTGELEEIKSENGHVDLLKDCTYYLDVDYLNRAGTVTIGKDGRTLNWDNFIGLKSEEVSGDSQAIVWDNQLSEGDDKLVINVNGNTLSLRLDEESGNASVLGLTQDASCRIVTVSDNCSYCSDDALLAATNIADNPVHLQGNDNNTNIFIATAKGTWDNRYKAFHTDMGFTTALNGKAKVTDIFSGNGTNNIVLLGDAEIGMALFVDDIYSDSPDKLATAQSRLNNLTMIIGGTGNDIIDMTSERFIYKGEGLTIYGGAGNDTIWAGHGDNSLFGEDGNDMLVGNSGNDLLVGGTGDDDIYGGGGDDICCFAGEWGHDKVTQTSEGTLVLCFNDGNADAWNAQSLCYDDGNNSLQVSGVSIDKITVAFGQDAKALLASRGYSI